MRRLRDQIQTNSIKRRPSLLFFLFKKWTQLYMYRYAHIFIPMYFIAKRIWIFASVVSRHNHHHLYLFSCKTCIITNSSIVHKIYSFCLPSVNFVYFKWNVYSYSCKYVHTPHTIKAQSVNTNWRNNNNGQLHSAEDKTNDCNSSSNIQSLFMAFRPWCQG